MSAKWRRRKWHWRKTWYLVFVTVLSHPFQCGQSSSDGRQRRGAEDVILFRRLAVCSTAVLPNWEAAHTRPCRGKVCKRKQSGFKLVIQPRTEEEEPRPILLGREVPTAVMNKERLLPARVGVGQRVRGLHLPASVVGGANKGHKEGFYCLAQLKC